MIRLVILLVFILIAVLIVLAVLGVRKVRRKQASEQQALAERADQQMAWLESGDDRGVFGDWSPKPEPEKVPVQPKIAPVAPCKTCNRPSVYVLTPANVGTIHLCEKCYAEWCRPKKKEEFSFKDLDIKVMRDLQRQCDRNGKPYPERLKAYLRELAALKTRLQASDPTEPGQSVNVNGIGQKIAPTGHCSTVTVNGIENVVRIDSADVIETSGINNRVTYRSGSPKIINKGPGNVVERG